MARSLKRAVITGIGVVAPNGIGLKQHWQGLKEGRNCVDKISFFDASKHPSKIAAEIRDFDPKAFIPSKEIKRMGRAAHMAVAASQMAIEDARLKITSATKNSIGVIVGTGTSGIEYAEDDFYNINEGGVRKMRPYAAIAGFGGALSSEISRFHGVTRFSLTTSTGCTGSSDAIGCALHAIRSGAAKTILSGGADACITPGILGAFCQMGATCTRFNDDPKRASRPFNVDRDGFVISEGAWIFVMEELGQAVKRGAKIYGEVSGYGATCDAYHMSRPDPSGRYSINAIRLAICDAKLKPREVELVVSYGNATPINDSYETMVLKKSLGDTANRIPITSVKSMMGHPIGASGASNVAAGLLSINEGVVSPTINYEHPDPLCDLDYTPNKARNYKAKTVLCNTFAFGAKNSALILNRHVN